MDSCRNSGSKFMLFEMAESRSETKLSVFETLSIKQNIMGVALSHHMSPKFVEEWRQGD